MALVRFAIVTWRSWRFFGANGCSAFIGGVVFLYVSSMCAMGFASPQKERGSSRKKSTIKGHLGPRRPGLKSKSNGLVGGVLGVKKTETLGPKVKKLKDGTLRFFFSGFNADVKKNGEVCFGRKGVSLIKGNPIYPRGEYQRRVVGAFAPGTVGGDTPWLPGAGFSAGSGGDMTEALMRAKGMDPYAADKLRFLKRSRRWRLSLRNKAHDKTSRSYLKSLPVRLNRLWRDSTRSLVQKRQILFELWDECLEPFEGKNKPHGEGAGPRGVGESKRRAMAQRAREVIGAFIKKHFPKGSSAAYTEKELRAIAKRRRGKTPFDPYGAL